MIILVADEIYAKKGENSEAWLAADLKKVVMLLKRRVDPGMPSKKLKLLALFIKWRSEERQRVHFVSALVAEVEDIDKDSDIDDDEEGMQVELV